MLPLCGVPLIKGAVTTVGGPAERDPAAATSALTRRSMTATSVVDTANRALTSGAFLPPRAFDSATLNYMTALEKALARWTDERRARELPPGPW